MMQIYFLSIVLNAIVGCYFAFDLKMNNDTVLPHSFSFLAHKNFKLIIGILAVLIGFLKLLSAVDVVFIGDLLPASAGLLGGFAILYEYYTDDSENETRKVAFFENINASYKKTLGYACLVISLVHFLLPNVLFL
ncbi:MAG TPA: hypothetical protein VFC68_05725 [Treponemataceae bacterium]|nr:hypothetical protein [Treponemataceae bacterium]